MALSISLIFPMYNEKEYLPKAVAAAMQALSSCTDDYEIIIVDDASCDGSQIMADKLAAQYDTVKVIHHARNRKLGGALKSGFRAASKEIVVYTDMDLPGDMVFLETCMPLIGACDIISAYRIKYEESAKRVLYSKVYNLLIRMLFGLRIRDVNFAFKIFKRQVIGTLDLKSEGSFINAEALVKAQYLGYVIKELPLAYNPRRWGSSRLSSPGVIMKIMLELVVLFPQITWIRIKTAIRRLKAVDFSLRFN